MVPGNHDSRNVGYVHFESLFTQRDSIVRFGGVTVVGIDSSEPDLDNGRIGRHRYPWIRDALMEHPEDFKIFTLHHHLLPIPGTGRERNVVHDAGDVLEILVNCGVDLVLSGHKHVPYAWRLEDMFIVNTGTVSTLRLRGNTKPCYNVVDIEGERVRVTRNYPFRGGEVIVEFDAAVSSLCSPRLPARSDGRRRMNDRWVGAPGSRGAPLTGRTRARARWPSSTESTTRRSWLMRCGNWAGATSSWPRCSWAGRRRWAETRLPPARRSTACAVVGGPDPVTALQAAIDRYRPAGGR